MAREVLRIGCGAGFWGDSEEGPAQLVRSGGIDVLVLDYLAEITMSLLSRARAKDPAAGYAGDFVTRVMAPLAGEIAGRGIRVVANAGGVNPLACRDALERALAERGVRLTVAAVLGDDLMPMADALRDRGTVEMFDGRPFPAKPWSANAYLGARPIAAALDAGADVVITGRCVDSALALGPLLHAFGWRDDDHDRLSAGSLAGHLIECGTQVTGGIVTDWRRVPGWESMGFPIAEVRADGTFVLTKPSGTGGLVTPETVAEQLVYEVGDPGAYRLPDVTCDWSGVRLEAAGPDRVFVHGARGRAPASQYKVSVTHADGFRASGTMMIGGREAAAKARRTADAVLARSARLLASAGLPPFRRTHVEVLGAESTYGPHAAVRDVREVVLKVAVHHDVREGAEVFSREFLPSATSMAQGITGFAAGRPKVTPLVRLFSCLVDKGMVPVRVALGGEEFAVAVAAGEPAAPSAAPSAVPNDPAPPPGPAVDVPLIALAYGRSGDKGNAANIGVLARRAEFLPVLRRALTADAVKAYLGHLVAGPVERFEWPGPGGFNFLLHDALDGGGTASLRHDPQGKALAQMLMDMPMPVPASWLAPGGPLAAWEDEQTGTTA
ncbi:MAG TPA: acyclic terpene utilization AtuA family protein [Azospirillum sp.]|nr:acyclic terpene utilization AtuA family protein [Azospirillum sp.]